MFGFWYWWFWWCDFSSIQIGFSCLKFWFAWDCSDWFQPRQGLPRVRSAPRSSWILVDSCRCSCQQGQEVWTASSSCSILTDYRAPKPGYLVSFSRTGYCFILVDCETSALEGSNPLRLSGTLSSRPAKVAWHSHDRCCSSPVDQRHQQHRPLMYWPVIWCLQLSALFAAKEETTCYKPIQGS